MSEPRIDHQWSDPRPSRRRRTAPGRLGSALLAAGVALGAGITAEGAGITAEGAAGTGAAPQRHASAESAGEGASAGLDRLEFLIGEWDQRGTMSAETFGDLGGPYEGPCSCRWGPLRNWVECDFASSALAGLGPYAIHVVIQYDAEAGAYRSFVINNYGDNTYAGSWDEDSTLVFRSQHGEEIQRVSYTPLEDGRVRFYVDQSVDGGRTWTAHTDAHWYREDVVSH